MSSQMPRNPKNKTGAQAGQNKNKNQKPKRRPRNTQARRVNRLEEIFVSSGMDSAPINPQQARTDLATCARQFIDPASVNRYMLNPDDSGTKRCVRRLPKTFTIKSDNPGTANGFRLVVKPSLKSPIWYSGPATTFPTTPGPLSIQLTTAKLIPAPTEGEAYYPGSAIVSLTSSNDTSISQFINAVANTTAGIHALSYIPLRWTGGTGYTVQIYGSVLNKHKFNLHVCTSDADMNWTEHGYLSVVPGEDNNFVLSDALDPYEFVGFYMACREEAISIKGHFVPADDTQAQTHFETPTSATQGSFLSELSDEVTGGRLIGLSVLVQNTTASLTKAGTAYAARLPTTISPFTPPEEIRGKVADNRYYQGIAEKGVYVWWLPTNYECRKFLDYTKAEAELADDNYLWVAFDGWSSGSATSSVSVTVTAIVELSIPNVLFEKLDAPTLSPAWSNYWSILQSLPAATCNPDHKSLLNSIYQGAKNAGSRLNELYQLNPKLFNQLIGMLFSA